MCALNLLAFLFTSGVSAKFQVSFSGFLAAAHSICPSRATSTRLEQPGVLDLVSILTLMSIHQLPRGLPLSLADLTWLRTGLTPVK